jgi:uncharacterized protein
MTVDSLSSEAIVVFAKSASVGQVKTRLSPEVSPEFAVELYRAFVADVTETVDETAARRGTWSKVLAFAGDRSDAIPLELRERGYVVVDQGEGDLGTRLEGVCQGLAEAGVERVVIIGTDSPTLHGEHLELAFDMLDTKDVVWGPSFDGGYYLIGLRLSLDDTSAHRVVFKDIDWSTSRVLSQSWRRVCDASLLCDLLGFWYDVDTIADVEMLEFHLLHYLAERRPALAQHTARLLSQRVLWAGNLDRNST